MTKYKTRKEIFDLAYAGIKSQGFKRSAKPHGCLYRGPEGRKCAIGWLIPDEKYIPEMENYSLRSSGILEVAEINPEDVNFCIELQVCHDKAYTEADMQFSLDHFRQVHDL